MIDIKLGGMSGVELQRLLRASGSTLPVIFITAYESETAHQQAFEAEYAAYLLKPFPASILIDAIRNASA